MNKDIILIGAPVDSGASQPGCLMGPDAFRTAGIKPMLADLAGSVLDRGNIAPRQHADRPHSNPALHHLAETIGWTEALCMAAKTACEDGFPIFMGGDHSLSLGSVKGVAEYAAGQNRPLFVLWLDAHPDFHTPHTTRSGNLHGTPLAYVTGQKGFDGFPEITCAVDPKNICIFGARSVDPAELKALKENNICIHDMRSIDENGIIAPISEFLRQVRSADGLLHVSLDVDFLEPSIAPAVGTTVPGGVTFREAHLVMELLHDSDLVTSLDLVELNPFLDDRGRTARLMVDLTASLMGRTVLDRPNRSH
ncbi:MAG: arginase [Rhodobacteraceae bacterium]|nr:arginase [Paracoccaceae bacterium]